MVVKKSYNNKYSFAFIEFREGEDATAAVQEYPLSYPASMARCCTAARSRSNCRITPVAGEEAMRTKSHALRPASSAGRPGTSPKIAGRTKVRGLLGRKGGGGAEEPEPKPFVAVEAVEAKEEEEQQEAPATQFQQREQVAEAEGQEGAQPEDKEILSAQEGSEAERV